MNTSVDHGYLDVRVTSVSFTDERLTFELDDGRAIAAPLAWFPRLIGATPEQRRNWELVGPGVGVHWPDMDEDLSVKGMLMGWTAPGGIKQPIDAAKVAAE